MKANRSQPEPASSLSTGMLRRGAPPAIEPVALNPKSTLARSLPYGDLALTYTYVYSPASLSSVALLAPVMVAVPVLPSERSFDGDAANAVPTRATVRAIAASDAPRKRS